jgi:hypothetical protein
MAKPMPLTMSELDFIEELKAAFILRKMFKLNPLLAEGYLLYTCGDCNRYPESYRYQKNLIKQAGKEPVIHLLALNGGPLLFPEHSPLNINGEESRVIKRQIEGTLKLKSLTAIVALFHGPCGAAQAAGLSIEEAFKWYVTAIEEMRVLYPGVDIVTQSHLHKPDEMSTYSIDFERLAVANLSRAATA